jgi:hypothetical protein
MTTYKLHDLPWSNSGGRIYTFEEYREMLLAARFIKVEKLSERLLSSAVESPSGR